MLENIYYVLKQIYIPKMKYIILEYTFGLFYTTNYDT